MDVKFKEFTKNELKTEIKRVTEQLCLYNPEDDEYGVIADNLAKLNELYQIRYGFDRTKLTEKAIAGVFMIGGIFVIISAERITPVVSKAIPFIPKLSI